MLLAATPSVLFACRKGGTVHRAPYMGGLTCMFWMHGFISEGETDKHFFSMSDILHSVYGDIPCAPPLCTASGHQHRKHVHKKRAVRTRVSLREEKVRKACMHACMTHVITICFLMWENKIGIAYGWYSSVKHSETSQSCSSLNKSSKPKTTTTTTLQGAVQIETSPSSQTFTESVGGIIFFIIFGTTRAAFDTLEYLLGGGSY